MPYYLGIDGGQSSTVALIADETGRVLGRGTAGPCNHVAAGEAAHKFSTVVGSCIGQACAKSGTDPATVHFASACLGFSGGPADKEAFTRALIRSDQFKITHDAEIALIGATAGEPGVIVIAGTGSIAFGKNADGRTARAGGWGYIFGDEGGAFDITRHALRAALQFEEGWGPDTFLRDKLLNATECTDANAMLHLFYTPRYPRDKIASLARLIDEAAQEGDQVAMNILDEAASNLAQIVQAVHRNLFESHESAVISYAGGVFQSAVLRTSFSDWVMQAVGRQITPPQLTPAEGALLEALRVDGIAAKLSNLKEGAK